MSEKEQENKLDTSKEKGESKLDTDEKIEKKINEIYDYSPTYLNEIQGNLKALNDLIEEYLESSPSLPQEDRKTILQINFEADELKIILFEAGFYSEKVVKEARQSVLTGKKTKECNKEAEITKKNIAEYEQRAPKLFTDFKNHIKKTSKIY